MNGGLSPELEDWDEIIDLAGRDNVPSQGKARAMAGKKHALAIANLGNYVFSAQKHISQRLDELNKRLDESSKASERVAKKTFWLTMALVVATVIQAIAAVALLLATNKVSN